MRRGRLLASCALPPRTRRRSFFAQAPTVLSSGPDLRFEEIEVSASCGQVGRTIRDLRVRAETGALIVGLRRRDGGYDTTPSPDTRLDAGDVLIVVGTAEELRGVEDLFAPRPAISR